MIGFGTAPDAEHLFASLPPLRMGMAAPLDALLISPPTRPPLLQNWSPFPVVSASKGTVTCPMLAMKRASGK